MKLRIMSDLHLEMHHHFNIPELPEDRNSILVLPGDICEVKRRAKFRPLMEQWSEQFRNVIWVFGNHEFYGHKLNRAHHKAREELSHLDNVTILHDESKIIDDVVFVGGTLWTDFQRENPVVTFDAHTKMSDYKRIRLGPTDADRRNGINGPYRKIRPDDILIRHYHTKRFIEQEVIQTRARGFNKHVVVTHHAPSWQSIDQEYKTDTLNGCYVSDFDYLVADLNVQVWCHGHVHQRHDYMIDNTRVICNPRGYIPRFPAHNFDPILCVDV